MADYTVSKAPAVSPWPPRSKDAAGSRLEPILTPDVLRHVHMFGIPLVSAVEDPITKQRAVMTDPILERIIGNAVEQVEVDLGISLLPTQFSERLPFKKLDYDSFGYMRLSRRPAWSIEKLVMESSDGQTLYTTPLQWVDVGRLYRGQLSVVPFSIGFTQDGQVIPPVAGTASGSAFLNVIQMHVNFVPLFWTCEYTAGFPDGLVPKIVNELVACVAAMDVLRQLGATHAMVTSSSLGLDGWSQSTASLGPNIYEPAIKALDEKRERIKGRVKAIFGLTFVMGSI